MVGDIRFWLQIVWTKTRKDRPGKTWDQRIQWDMSFEGSARMWNSGPVVLVIWLPLKFNAHLLFLAALSPCTTGYRIPENGGEAQGAAILLAYWKPQSKRRDQWCFRVLSTSYLERGNWAKRHPYFRKPLNSRECKPAISLAPKLTSLVFVLQLYSSSFYEPPKISVNSHYLQAKRAEVTTVWGRIGPFGCIWDMSTLFLRVPGIQSMFDHGRPWHRSDPSLSGGDTSNVTFNWL